MTRRTAIAVVLAACCGGAAATPPRALRHDPFALPAAVRAPAPAAEGAAAAPPPRPWKPQLRAVIVAARGSMALVDGSVVAIGEQLDGYRLVEVAERRATFVKDGVRVVLNMDSARAETR